MNRYFSFFVAGIGLGWLVGMSASPVIQGIVTAMTSVIVTVLGLFSESDDQHDNAQRMMGTPLKDSENKPEAAPSEMPDQVNALGTVEAPPKDSETNPDAAPTEMPDQAKAVGTVGAPPKNSETKPEAALESPDQENADGNATGVTEESPSSGMMPFGVTVQPAIIATLIAGIVIGAITGIWMRTHNWLGKSDSDIIAEWSTFGFEKRDVAHKLFEYRFPRDNPTVPKKVEISDREIVTEWASLGLEKKEVARKLFDYRFAPPVSVEEKKAEKPGPPDGKKNQVAAGTNPIFGALYGATVTAKEKKLLCDLVQLLKGEKDETTRKIYEDRLKHEFSNVNDAKIRAWAEKNFNRSSLLLSFAEVICAD